MSRIFCNWFLRSAHDGEVDPELMFFYFNECLVFHTWGGESSEQLDLFRNFLFMMEESVYGML
jgi:hypothetical protein